MIRRLVNYFKYRKFSDDIICCRNYRCPVYRRCYMKFGSKIYTAENYPFIDEAYKYLKFKDK